MPKAVRYAMVAVGLLAVVSGAAAVVLVLGDRGSDDNPTIIYRVCDTIVRFREGEKPEDLEVEALTYGGSTGDYRGHMVMVVRRRDAGELWIDPTNGSIARGSPRRGAFKDVLERVEVNPLNPGDAPWPYTDDDKGEPVTAGSLSYIPPALGAGIAQTFASIDGTPSGQGVGITNCRSHMEVIFWRRPDGGVQKEVQADQVDPQGGAAFQRFADEVKISAEISLGAN